MTVIAPEDLKLSNVSRTRCPLPITVSRPCAHVDYVNALAPGVPPRDLSSQRSPQSKPRSRYNYCCRDPCSLVSIYAYKNALQTQTQLTAKLALASLLLSGNECDRIETPTQ